MFAWCSASILERKFGKKESEPMIVYKQWLRSRGLGLDPYTWEGWFLFGFIPLYMRRIGRHF